MEVTHVKPHGALNNVACVDTATAEAIARAVFGVSPALIMLAPAASELLAAAERRGLRTASEVFADRQYMADGTLAPRSIPGSVIHDAEEAIEHALRLASVRLTRERTLDLSLSRAVSPEQLVAAQGLPVKAMDTGEEVVLRADSICTHQPHTRLLRPLSCAGAHGEGFARRCARRQAIRGRASARRTGGAGGRGVCALYSPGDCGGCVIPKAHG